MLSSIAFDGFPSAGSPRSSALPFNGQAQSDGAFGKPDRGRDGLGMTGPSWERDDSPFSPSAESPAANDALSRLKARLELSKGEATNGESASRAFSEIRDESTKPSSPTRHASVPRLKTRFDWAKPDDPHGDSSGNRSSANFGSQSTDDKVRLAMALENPRNVAPGNANWQDTVAPPPKSTPTRFREMADDNASVVSNVPSLLETSLKQQPLPPPSQPSAQHRAVDAAVLSVGPLARDLEDVRAQVKTLRQGQENLTKKVETADGGMEERMKAFVQQLFEKLWQSIMQCNSRVDAELQKREKGSADSNKKLQDDLQNCMEDLQTYAEKARQTNDDILRLRAEIEDVPGIRDLEDFSHGLRTELDALAERARKADVRLDTEIEDWTIAREALHKKVNDHADREKKELQDLKLEMKTLEQQLPPLKEWQHAQQQKQEKTEEKLLASASQLEQLSAKVQELSDNVADFDEAMWKKLDDDGNGFVNFAEFVEFLAACKVDLPLGLDDLLGRETGSLRCGVLDCSCKEFVQRRKRCKYGAACYQRKEEHLRQFSHPNDNDWGETSIYRDADMCACGHKRQLHASACSGAGSVDYPTYWASQCGRDAECLELVPVDAEMVRQFQALLDATYSDVTTRDRANHSGGCWMVPRNYSLVSALRNENSRLWRKYTIRKAELQREKKLTDENPQLAAELPPYFVYSDVKTTKVWESFGGVDTLDRNINEWYLFHGTSPKAAEMICRTDFKYTLAGSATGTLYGRGSYLAEAITKADEYSSADESTDGCFTVLLCRVLGGRVRYCDQRVPHPDQLTADCVEGPYDCILGDREKLSGTYREFITFDTENLYPEYILRYTRGELFKSPSYPANQP
mmetsp:Transcript_66452/g.185207  ORF Transcript_66452/g.185207 Transcript_66452/m.185207 type:complete len:861 (+) Transcript_66452:60-2642(+)